MDKKVKDAINLGIGASLCTKEKVEDMLADVSEKNGDRKDDLKGLVSKIVDIGLSTKKEVEARVEDAIREFVDGGKKEEKVDEIEE